MVVFKKSEKWGCLKVHLNRWWKLDRFISLISIEGLSLKMIKFGKGFCTEVIAFQQDWPHLNCIFKTLDIGKYMRRGQA
jgi:hypothetical protein